MRQLRYTLEFPDGSHHDHAAIAYGEAETLVRNMDWKAVRDVSLDSPEPSRASGTAKESPFLLFIDEGESFFMILPEGGGFHATAKVLDKWNLLGIVSKQKAFNLDFGLVTLEDSLVLLRLFFEDNYPALRALQKDMGWNG